MKTKYDVTGPSDVMWGVDDEIRDEIRTVAGMGSLNDELIGRISDVITRAEEMIYKALIFPNLRSNCTRLAQCLQGNTELTLLYFRI